MKTGLKKAQKETMIWFHEAEKVIHVRTQNTDLRNRLSGYAEKYPACCRVTDTDREIGCMEFEIEKGRLSFRLTAPYSTERREQARAAAKAQGLGGKTAD